METKQFERIDTSRTFFPVRIAVLTVSDTREADSDESGDILVKRITDAGHMLAARAISRDDYVSIQKIVKEWIADKAIDVVITAGGTGITGHDVTPEAIEALYDKFIPGFGDLFRMLSYSKIGTSTIQSRATAGVARGTYLFALPGSPAACRDAWEDILVHQLDIRHRPCNLIELLPRLQE